MVSAKLISASTTSITRILLAVPACSGLLSLITAATMTNMSKITLIINIYVYIDWHDIYVFNICRPVRKCHNAVKQGQIRNEAIIVNRILLKKYAASNHLSPYLSKASKHFEIYSSSSITNFIME